MEQIYRRRSRTIAPKKHSGEGGYKQSLIRRSAVCFLIFMIFLGIKNAPAEQLQPVQNAVMRILTENTDFLSIPERIRTFFGNERQLKENVDDMGSKAPLLDLIAPVEGTVTSEFGLRTHPTDGEEAFHYGVDLGAEAGEQIKAAAGGTVAEAGFSDTYGNYVLLQHSDTIYTLYAHCESLSVQQGESVEQEQVIATVGATGNATGAHLHFEVRDQDTYLDPAEFIDFTSETKHD